MRDTWIGKQVGMRSSPGIILLATTVAACGGSPSLPSNVGSSAPPSGVGPAAVANPSPMAAVPAAPVDDARRQRFAEWLRARIPPGGRVDDVADRPLDVVHTAAAGDTPLTIAKAYLDVTDVYRAKDLAAAIAKESPDVRPGVEVRIPHLLAEPYRDPSEDRMVWPADHALRGVYITGETAGASWPETIDRVQSHGLNAIVLDAKGWGGTTTYPSHVKPATENAGKNAPIPDYSRAIRFAHLHGIYVIARVTCFHDPWLAAHLRGSSIRSTSGRPAAVGWVDPANPEVQGYVLDLVKEVIDLGADEVQLDYVRFPVEDLGDAVMLPPDGHRSHAIASFVSRVHEITQEHRVPLSVDVFGIAGSAARADIEALGQNLPLLGPEVEAVSPMVYPSHYPVGSLGFEQPGDHPELVGFGTKAAVGRLTAGAGGSGGHVPIVRPWLQASSFRTTSFGPKYIQDEIRSAEASGGVGWLMWSAGNNYWAVWKALPVVAEPKSPGETSAR
jgi:hypothetical protein